MIKNNKKQIFVALVIVLCLFILSFVIMYLCNVGNQANHDINQDALEINFSQENKVLLNNILPVGDNLGKRFDGKGTEEGIQGYSEFELKNISEDKVNFEIYLTRKDTDTKCISENYIKCYLTDGADNALEGFHTNKIPTYKSLVVLNDKPNSKLLFKGNINSKSNLKFKLRVWLDDTYVISQNKESFEFTIGVRVV